MAERETRARMAKAIIRGCDLKKKTKCAAARRTVTGLNIFIRCHRDEQTDAFQTDWTLTLFIKTVFSFAFSIQLPELLERPHVHPSIHAATNSPGR